ncbi:colorectal mutant cancer protein isoform X2 [Bacillus rossius redtenbacheri]|uniref:colorectal mutant cancer protein isoform X2 n=1 Tax=Bacillus rossius redtenbacheri TaxID=93214 RepID=UPI002FDE5C14
MSLKESHRVKKWEMRTILRGSLRRLKRSNSNGQDLLTVCRELNLEDSLEELMRELGADEHGRISYQEFLRRRLALRPEIDALRGRARPGRRSTPEYLPTSSDNSLGAASAGKLESWEFDSGARDLSPEPHTLQKLVEAAGGSLTAGSTSNMLDLANKLHLAALASLKGEILDLSSRLHSVTQERDLLDKSLNKIQLERIRDAVDAEEKLDGQAQRYEERLTELHSVIAELSRKIDRQRTLVIREEEDVSETEDQDISRDAEGSTTHLADDSELQDVDRTIGDAESSTDDNDNPVPEAEEPGPLDKETATSCRSLQAAALAEELAQQRADNQALRDQLARQEQELTEARLRGDRERQRRKARELEGGKPKLPASPPPLSSLAVVPQDDMPVCKVAERVMLRRMDRHITGSQLASLGVCHTRVAESLVSELQEADRQELRGSEAARRQYEAEAERLAARLEHARAQNTVLALTLEEAKTQADRLSLLVGKYESNATALRLALGYSDRAIEAYDVLVALLESELGLLLANCRAAGIGKQLNIRGEGVDGDLEPCEVNSILRRARENRRAAETVARHLLSRLDSVSVSNAICLSAAPWEEYSHTTSTSSSGEGEWGQGEERRLRDHIGRLKTDRATVRATVVELESCHAEPPGSRQAISLAEARKLDLETAVLMQELMATREDKAELRARAYLLEKERASLELKLAAQEAQQAAQLAAAQHLRAQLQEAEQLLEARNKGVTSESEDGDAGTDEQSELGAALRREARLKERVQELVGALDTVSHGAELRQQQSADLVTDLKKANSALVQTLDRSKKKYQSRLRKLEQQMLAMVDRHSTQVRCLKQRVATLEEELVQCRMHSYQPVTTQGSHSQSSGASETSL